MDGNNENKGFFKTLFSDGIGTAWKLLPLPVKVKIIAISGGVFLLFVIIAGVVSLNPLNFIGYSNNSTATENFEETY